MNNEELSRYLKLFLTDNFTGFSVQALPSFIFSFLVCATLGFLLNKAYVKFGHSISNRRSFGSNFLLLAVTTMFIISVVKSSLALSLGLVGALSIVRFRSAIKEPEELVYLFMTIAIGLGCGAGLTFLTILVFCGFVLFIWINSRYRKPIENQSLYLTVSSNNSKVDLNKIIEVLKTQAGMVKLKRSDETETAMEASFLIDFDDYAHLEKTKDSLRSIYPNLNVTFMDNSRDY